MSIRSIPPRALLLPGSIALVIALALAMAGSPRIIGTAATVQGSPSLTASGWSETVSRDSLTLIRNDALQGNADASAELAQRLMNRFDQTGEPDNLQEAFQWIGRDWDRPEFLRTDVVQRAVTRHCDAPILRWHWLCTAGE